MVTRINPCRDQDLDTLFCNDARPCAGCRRYGVRKSWRRIGGDEELDTLFSRTHTGRSHTGPEPTQDSLFLLLPTPSLALGASWGTTRVSRLKCKGRVDPAQATPCAIHRLPRNSLHARDIPPPTLRPYGTRIGCFVSTDIGSLRD